MSIDKQKLNLMFGLFKPNNDSSLVCLSRTMIQDSRRMESESGGVYVSFKTLWASPGAKVYGLKVKLNRPSSSPDINYPCIFVCLNNPIIVK